jgi:hypothetical protein
MERFEKRGGRARGEELAVMDLRAGAGETRRDIIRRGCRGRKTLWKGREGGKADEFDRRRPNKALRISFEPSL